MRLKFLLRREPLFILIIPEKNSSVIISFEILLWLSGCDLREARALFDSRLTLTLG